ncbi:MAG: helix-turn-helix domain-containing protein [Clostridia bacterium]|nr:helix-turn-helix domain-containing protein [Clostridia bacterium]
MSDIKYIISKNISLLRQNANMTQLKLAEKLNYSDKAVSKWERGEAVPDIKTLLDIADLFGVTVDYLVRSEHTKSDIKEKTKKYPKYNHWVIILASIVFVWLLAIITFIILNAVISSTPFKWLVFIYAAVISAILWLILNSVWYKNKLNYVIVSLIMWSVLVSIYLSLLVCGINLELIYLLGAPGQIIILLWSFFKKAKQNKNN